jgi:acyl carrier protein
VSGATPTVEARVRRIVAEALDRPEEQVRPSSSLIDDLGAESIDFLDLLFRLESAFGIKIPEEDLWGGAAGLARAGAGEFDRGIADLRKEMPDFRWDRFPDGVSRSDLPRLITVGTVVRYLERVAAPDVPPAP